MPRVLYPLLKPADYPHRELVVTMPLPGTAMHPRLPIVTFAENLPSGYSVLTRDDPDRPEPSRLLPEALAALAKLPRDLMVLPEGIAVHGGQDLAAELLLDGEFLRQVAVKLNTSELWVCVPHRVAFYAMSARASATAKQMLTALVRTELESGPSKGHAPVSDLAFRVREGVIVEAVPYAALDDRPAARPSIEPAGLNWTAGFLGGFFGGVVGMGVGIGIISMLDVDPSLQSPVVFGLAGLCGAVALVLGLRWR